MKANESSRIIYQKKAPYFKLKRIRQLEFDSSETFKVNTKQVLPNNFVKMFKKIARARNKLNKSMDDFKQTKDELRDNAFDLQDFSEQMYIKHDLSFIMKE